MIELALGDRDAARSLLRRALQVDPWFSILGAPEARRILARLELGIGEAPGRPRRRSSARSSSLEGRRPAAHPLGNFTANRYAGIVLRPEEVAVHYVLDLAEIPAFQEETAIDTDGDGVDEGELRSWAVAATRPRSFLNDLDVEVDREPVVLRVRRSSAEPDARPVKAAFPPFRLEATFRGPYQRWPQGC